MSGRSLKIEADGDFHAGLVKPKIRLCGQWLERAGFPPGARVSVSIPDKGRLVLTLEERSCSNGDALEAERKQIMERLASAMAAATKGGI